jgi:CheY-like chemotaxis protein
MKKYILYIDDDPDNQENLRFIFADGNPRLLSALSLKEAREYLAQFKGSVVAVFINAYVGSSSEINSDVLQFVTEERDKIMLVGFGIKVDHTILLQKGCNCAYGENDVHKAIKDLGLR